VSDTLRVIFTGSQKWDDPEPIGKILTMYTMYAFGTGRHLLAVHGAHWAGADEHVSAWISRHRRKGWPVDQERHPADWFADCIDRCYHGPRKLRKGKSSCQAAGQYRNEHMARCGGDACEAFLRGGSPGTSRMIRLVKQLHIPTEVTPWEQRHTERHSIAQHPGQAGLLLLTEKILPAMFRRGPEKAP
jgi:hypothetical protein